MAEQLDISLVERQRCAIKFCNPAIRPSSLWRRAAVFKWWKRFRDGETNVKGQKRLFHYPPETCSKRSAARFREVGGAL
jgi:hypothetical protein